MECRILGTQGLVVGAIGLGCMSMSDEYGRPEERNERESIATIHRAMERGVTLLDTAEVYGPYTNEELLGKALRGRRERAVIATKFGLVGGVDGSPVNAKRAVEGSLRRMGTDVIDVYYLHRKDPAIPIEESVGAMGELVREGKVRHLGLSEVGPETLRRAHRVHPISVLQSEYSLWERGVEEAILPTLRELGIGFVPFSPLGRGYLTGSFQSIRDLSEGDWRANVPRFNEEHAEKNSIIVQIIRDMADRKGVTSAQIALAWILQQGTDIVPIPGTKRCRYLDENLDAETIRFSEQELAELNGLASMTAGARYLPWMMKLIER